MTDAVSPSQVIIIDRYLSHAPTKVWRALTEQQLLARWLNTSDFRAEVGHRFHVRRTPTPHWNGITVCVVLDVCPPERLSYRWSSSDQDGLALSTVVTWSLQPKDQGTLLRLEQSGFQETQVANRRGAQLGWPRSLDGLSALLDDLN